MYIHEMFQEVSSQQIRCGDFDTNIGKQFVIGLNLKPYEDKIGVGNAILMPVFDLGVCGDSCEDCDVKLSNKMDKICGELLLAAAKSNCVFIAEPDEGLIKKHFSSENVKFVEVDGYLVGICSDVSDSLYKCVKSETEYFEEPSGVGSYCFGEFGFGIANSKVAVCAKLK